MTTTATGPTTELQRFWPKADTSGGPDACWPWMAARQRTGYGIFGRNGRSVLAHRAAYEMLVGLIPDGLTIDHLCRNRGCVNPRHMEPVTQGVNTMRGFSMATRHAMVTHCPKGHEYTIENTIWRPRGSRQCRICQDARNRIRKACENCGRIFHHASLARHRRQEAARAV